VTKIAKRINQGTVNCLLLIGKKRRFETAIDFRRSCKLLLKTQHYFDIGLKIQYFCSVLQSNILLLIYFVQKKNRVIVLGLARFDFDKKQEKNACTIKTKHIILT